MSLPHDCKLSTTPGNALHATSKMRAAIHKRRKDYAFLRHLTEKLRRIPNCPGALRYENQAGIVHTRQEKKHVCFLAWVKERPWDEVHWGTLSLCIHQHQQMLLLQPKLTMPH